ncbi:unnamed protein product [Ilex paraguariensis]|uniref:Growth-regulating factor n=1 Tax=Ilex paraguariensis TaxID=185542 RepID=A0ABC8SCD1_9AQUA
MHLAQTPRKCWFFGFSPQVFDYGSMMDPEPGRCRRTDGKKWRCSRDVVPGQKYCERHMHRGRQRSRKHVESSKNISESDTTITITSSDTSTAINSYNTTNTIANLSVSVPPNLHLMIPSSSDYSNNVPAIAETTTTSSRSGNSRVNKINIFSDSSATPTTINFCNIDNRSKNNVGVNRDTTVTTTFISAVADKFNTKDNSYCIGDKDTGFDHSNYRLVKRSSSNVKEVKIGGSVAPRFGISPNSVLQDGTVTGCSSSVFEYSNSADTDLQRCRRTDGKKWRCSRGVIPDQKYCQRHMHRGARKLSIASESAIISEAAPPRVWSSAAPIAKPKKLDNRINLNTNLSISITPSLQQKTDGENSSTRRSSSSDATTITDENTSICNMASLSP